MGLGDQYAIKTKNWRRPVDSETERLRSPEPHGRALGWPSQEVHLCRVVVYGYV